MIAILFIFFLPIIVIICSKCTVNTQKWSEKSDGLHIESNGTHVIWRYGQSEPEYLSHGRGVLEIARRENSSIVTIKLQNGFQTMQSEFNWNSPLHKKRVYRL